MSDPFVKVVAFSVSPQGIPLITAHFKYWRAIHSEVMTHRDFSRNGRSSRAVPVAKILEEVRNDPFVPRHWGKNQKGMQAGEECNKKIDYDPPEGGGRFDAVSEFVGLWSESREDAWLHARDYAADVAECFSIAGYHKQVPNRLLEPFMWMHTLVTSTNWANFFALRDHPDAEPHLRDLAQLAKEEFGRWRGKGTLLQPGEWHTPYVDDEEKAEIWLNRFGGGQGDQTGHLADECSKLIRKISAARCARISYEPFDGDGSVEAELRRYDALVRSAPVHASPVEHQATPDVLRSVTAGEWQTREGHRNFRGWIQHRSIVKNDTAWDTEETDRWLVG